MFIYWYIMYPKMNWKAITNMGLISLVILDGDTVGNKNLTGFLEGLKKT